MFTIPHPEDPVFPRVAATASEAVNADYQPAGPTSGISATATHVVIRVQGGASGGFPDVSGFYPSSEIRLGNEGVSLVNVCVNAKGMLTAAPTTARGSGLPRLDEAARKLAKAGSGHYRPSTEDGVAVDSCYPLGVRFQIKK